MIVERFFVPHSTGTYADALEAVGLALLLDNLSGDSVSTIKDSGPYFEIQLNEPLILEELPVDQVLPYDPGYPYFMTAKDKNVPAGYLLYDYEEEKKIANTYWEQYKKQKAKKTATVTSDVAQTMQGAEPNPRHNLLKNMYVLQAFNSHNRLLSEFAAADPEAVKDAIIEKLRTYCHGCLKTLDAPDPIPKEAKRSSKAQRFAPDLTAVQALNPIVGKGINRNKPTGTGLAGLPSAYVDWFAEYLRYLAVHCIANAFNVGDDIKYAVLVPGEVSFNELKKLADDFVRLPLGKRTSCQLDIHNAIGLAEKLIDHSRQLQEHNERQTRWKLPKQVIAGIATAYFKSLGSGKALTNVNTIGLPGWFPIETIQDADDWKQILEEHRRIMYGLDEEHSEEAELLYQYRDFISSGQLKNLLDFAASYGAFVFKQAANQKRGYLGLSQRHLERLVTSLSKPFSDIVKDEGFRAIADAIRRSTVVEQYRKSQGRQEYEIRYGLFSDLKRKSRSKQELICLIGDFVSDYNKENARKEEVRAKKAVEKGAGELYRRPSVSDDAIEKVVALIDIFGSEPVAMLLAAFGSAKTETKKETKTDGKTETSVKTETSADTENGKDTGD
ncbi:hypothetical protein HM1_0511 [Heliomicrobium modesticaldum Ice1]|uniref:Uncharacterized protein n=1 Tax=Heliobacterium modesticaldum (strain ATCC 51547 / Ice1) TaxID=498761 RepID=B0TFM6_HELMI|nr:hypothetical protein [Heliomicrobium modesticaldum]ABZ83125.1 hypothetical protein HM1_0511 [Heliomicrobium modesticaldum Ice1]